MHMVCRLIVISSILVSACETGNPDAAHAPMALSATDGAAPLGAPVTLPGDYPFDAYAIREFNEPWAMTFLPDGRLLVTEQAGRLLVVDVAAKSALPIANVPAVEFAGQGGFGDIVLHPEFDENQLVYFSYVAPSQDGKHGAVVARATLALDATGGALQNIETLWRQTPIVTGNGHYGHRIAFSEDGYLFISSGERQKFTPSQEMDGNLGKVVRLFDDGRIPDDNPFADQGGVTAQIWSLGHRNPLGLAFDAQGRLWNSEMGPRHGDELNLVEPGNNYGYPLVSNGDHYNRREIPDHDTRPDLDAPAAYWVPAISPAGLMFYDGALFPDWNGNAFLGGLSSQALVRVTIDGESAQEAERYPMGQRIREMEQGPDGAIWLLEDGPNARLLKLLPAR